MCAKMLFLGYNGPLSGEQHEEGGVGVAWNLQKLPFFPKYAEIRSRIQPNYLCLAWLAKKSTDPKDWWFKYSFIYLCIIGLLLVLPDKVVYLVTNIAGRNSRLGHTTYNHFCCGNQFKCMLVLQSEMVLSLENTCVDTQLHSGAATNTQFP